MRCGLASYIGYIGIIIDRPSIGVAKNILCSSVNADHFIDVDGVCRLVGLGSFIIKHESMRVKSFGSFLSYTTTLMAQADMEESKEW
ncbi:MAG TPA: endonuclease V [Candidatus Nitrosopolaris sp.]|nr:endonuclease V [Candidatus Nitrosopolaris sp.]